ncbi:hypothetical protein Syun_000845 [Stephania yunnanensis]|uniref:Uncharacterized protein n=1 Tax=Stephania yunnanensis TaxID=152371 RepID=A0AAP0LFI7_9MAGN
MYSKDINSNNKAKVESYKNEIGESPKCSKKVVDLLLPQHSEVEAGAGSFHLISAHDEPIELLRKDIKDIQTLLLRIMQDNTLARGELRQFQEQLAYMEQALMDRLGISFEPLRDVPDDSKTDNNLDD